MVAYGKINTRLSPSALFKMRHLFYYTSSLCLYLLAFNCQHSVVTGSQYWLCYLAVLSFQWLPLTGHGVSISRSEPALVKVSN